MTPRRTVRAACFALIGLALAAFFIWLLRVPRRPERLLRFVPAEASWVWVHANPAADWEALVSNPATRGVLGRMGFDGAALENGARDPAVRAWISRLASDTTVLFGVPGPHPDSPQAFHGAAGWLGGRSQRLRWMLKLRTAPGIERAGSFQGRAIWVWRDPDAAGSPPLFFAFEEGVLAACLSENPANLIRMLNAYDRNAPAFDFGPDPPDLSRNARPEAVLARPGPVRFRLDSLEPERLSGRAEWAAPGILRPGRPAAAPEPPACLSGPAEAMVWISPGLIRAGARSLTASEWLYASWPYIEPFLGGPIALGMYGGPLSGRARGLRVPALVIAAPAADPESAVRRLRGAVRSLNMALETDLSIEPGPEGRHGLAGSVFGDLPPDERPAFAFRDGWLLLASHAFTLRALMEQSPAPRGPGPDPAAALTGWADLERGGTTLRAGLAVLSLHSALAGSGDGRIREQTRLAREWILALEPLGRVEVRMRETETGYEAAFESRAPRGEAAP